MAEFLQRLQRERSAFKWAPPESPRAADTSVWALQASRGAARDSIVQRTYLAAVNWLTAASGCPMCNFGKGEVLGMLPDTNSTETPRRCFGGGPKHGENAENTQRCYLASGVLWPENRTALNKAEKETLAVRPRKAAAAVLGSALLLFLPVSDRHSHSTHPLAARASRESR